jgi:hypothetical protein
MSRNVKGSTASVALIAAVTLAAVVAAVAGPASTTSASTAGPAGGGIGVPGVPPVRVDPRPIPITAAAKARPGLLPRGARGTFPGFNGDGLFITLAPKRATSVSAATVFKQTIGPVLRAAGFPSQGAGSFGLPRRSKGEGRRRASLHVVAALTCAQLSQMRDKMVEEMCAVLTGKEKATPQIDAAFQNGEGMTFAQFKADIERRQIQYFFPQLVGTVPIEHTGLLASRWEGETITVVNGHLFTRFRVVNARKLGFTQAFLRGRAQLLKLENVLAVSREPGKEQVLVALPYGGARDAAGRLQPALRYAYRTLVRGSTRGIERASWIAYFDAASGAVLELIPQDAETTAVGEQWRRAPDTPTELNFFDVDPATGGQYTLAYAGVFNRVDRLGDGNFDDDEVSISSSSGGSSASLANFNQSPINDDANAVCGAGGNNTYRQVNVFSHLSRLHSMIVGAGAPVSFPEAAVTIWTDATDTSASYDYYGSGQSRVRYGAYGGFTSSSCPNASGFSNGGEDTTAIAHEFAHLSTPRLQDRRPTDWCGSPSCPDPTGRLLFHDFADAIAEAYASLPCIAGWLDKNVGGTNASLNCVGTTSEGGGLPRLTDVTVPFNSASPGDHFPEHRLLATGDYADGQIAAAALWQVRRGMRSKCLPSGTPQYFVRLIRALWNYGFIGSLSAIDRDIYRSLQDLERQMTQQWATSGLPGGPPGFFHNGNHTTNKVTSGFARTGIFLVPYQCIDGSNATTDPAQCPAGENGGDAIIDVSDNDAADDPTIDGIVHPENDWLERSGPPPTFHVWTGPRFKFDAAGSASGYTPSTSTPSPCYPKYQVELATSADFTGTLVTSTPSSGSFLTVSTTTGTQCYAAWTPTTAQWNSLKGTSGETRIYYRVRTRNAAGDTATERISTSPGNGLYTVPAPYTVVNDSGTP